MLSMIYSIWLHCHAFNEPSGVCVAKYNKCIMYMQLKIHMINIRSPTNASSNNKILETIVSGFPFFITNFIISDIILKMCSVSCPSPNGLVRFASACLFFLSFRFLCLFFSYFISIPAKCMYQADCIPSRK